MLTVTFSSYLVRRRILLACTFELRWRKCHASLQPCSKPKLYQNLIGSRKVHIFLDFTFFYNRFSSFFCDFCPSFSTPNPNHFRQGAGLARTLAGCITILLLGGPTWEACQPCQPFRDQKELPVLDVETSWNHQKTSPNNPRDVSSVALHTKKGKCHGPIPMGHPINLRQPTDPKPCRVRILRVIATKQPQVPKMSKWDKSPNFSAEPSCFSSEFKAPCWKVQKTRWSPRTRMPTRMSRKRDLILTCHNFQRTHLWNTLTWHTEVTLL